MSSNIKILKICEYCRNEFVAKKTTSKTCSDDCAKRFYKKNKNSGWKFPFGFYVGMPLEKVIAANGKDFKFYGFEWDYSGMLASWEKGKLENEGVSIILSAPDNVNDSIYSKFSGEKQYNTSNPELRSLGLIVEEITFSNIKK